MALLFTDYTETVDPTRDLATHRILITKFNKVHIEQEGPHGFWYCHLDKGGSPKGIMGAFTSYEEALKAVKTYYLNNKNEVIKEEVK